MLFHIIHITKSLISVLTDTEHVLHVLHVQWYCHLSFKSFHQILKTDPIVFFLNTFQFKLKLNMFLYQTVSDRNDLKAKNNANELLPLWQIHWTYTLTFIFLSRMDFGAFLDRVPNWLFTKQVLHFCIIISSSSSSSILTTTTSSTHHSCLIHTAFTHAIPQHAHLPETVFKFYLLCVSHLCLSSLL